MCQKSDGFDFLARNKKCANVKASHLVLVSRCANNKFPTRTRQTAAKPEGIEIFALEKLDLQFAVAALLVMLHKY